MTFSRRNPFTCRTNSNAGKGSLPKVKVLGKGCASSVTWFVHLSESSGKFAVFPGGSRSFPARPSAVDPPPGRAWGCPPHTPGRGESPAPRKNAIAFFRMLWNRQRHGGTVRKAFPNPRTGTRSARCPNRPNCPNCPRCSRCPRETCEKIQRFLPEKF